MDADKEPEVVPVVQADASTAAAPLSTLLRERLTQALQELAQCHSLLAEHQVPCKGTFSSKLEDHADVLQTQLDEGEAVSVAPAAVAAATVEAAGQELANLKAEHARELEEVRGLLNQREAEIAALRAHAFTPKEQQRQQDGADVVEVGAAGSEEALPSLGEAAAGSSHTEARERGNDHAREKERLEVELSMAKALLMLNNVNMSIDLDEDRGVASSAAEVVSLKGSKQLVQLLLTLKQKSFRMAMQQQSQEHSSLQSRFERLSKVLN